MRLETGIQRLRCKRGSAILKLNRAGPVLPSVKITNPVGIRRNAREILDGGGQGYWLANTRISRLCREDGVGARRGSDRADRAQGAASDLALAQVRV